MFSLHEWILLMSPYWIPESVIGAVPIPLCSVLIVTLTGIRSTWCYHIRHRMTKHPHQIAEHVHNTQKALGWTSCRAAARITRAKWEGSPNADVNVEAPLEKLRRRCTGWGNALLLMMQTLTAMCSGLSQAEALHTHFPLVVTKRHTFIISQNSPDQMSHCDLYEILLTGALDIVIGQILEANVTWTWSKCHLELTVSIHIIGSITPTIEISSVLYLLFISEAHMVPFPQRDPLPPSQFFLNLDSSSEACMPGPPWQWPWEP